MLGGKTRLRFSCLAATALLVGYRGSAEAQDSYHWSRYHAEPPLGEILPEALAAPPSPVESGKLGERPSRDLVENMDGSFSYDETGFTARVDGEGRVRFRDKSSIRGNFMISPLFLAMYGTFDATDMLMRWLGEDPYSYQKMQFLERTFEERARMRRVYAQKNMDRAIAELPDYLTLIWNYEEWPVELRRRVLFALWDECAEKGNSLIVAGGADARAEIERFVRVNLGPGNPAAFGAEELARLNELRTSEARFDPYAASRSHPAMIANSAASAPVE